MIDIMGFMIPFYIIMKKFQSVDFTFTLKERKKDVKEGRQVKNDSKKTFK